MKKIIDLFLVLSLLSVSGNLFAQDESSFKVKFSISTQLATDGILWSPEKSSAVSNPFCAEKKTYPTLNLAKIRSVFSFLSRSLPEAIGNEV